MFANYHLTILWTFLSIFAESLQDCYPEEGSSHIEADVTCWNMTLKDSWGQSYQPLFNNIEAISFVGSTGDFRQNVLRNMTSLKGLMVYRSRFEAFEPEVHTLQKLQIHHSQFANHTNFDKCCRRLTKLLMRNNSGFFLEESIFKKLSRLQKLELSHQDLNHLTKSVFEGLNSLQKLRISDMNFKKIDADAFADLTKLKELYIDEPNIQELDENLFKPLSNLKVLNIMNARNLKPLSLEMFSELKSLRQLGLPLTTWKQIDVEKIPVMFPKLYAYSHSGNWHDREEEKMFRVKFTKLNYLIFNKTDNSF